MNDATRELLVDVTVRVERSIVARDCPAIVGIQGQRNVVLSDYDYLRDRDTAVAFELRAAEHARRVAAERWVFAVPMFWRYTNGVVMMRRVSNSPPGEGEIEAIVWTAFDVGNGVDFGLVPYTRRPNGDPVFDEPETITAPVQAFEQVPGGVLLKTLLDHTDPDSRATQ